jgi:hypothetical protein
MNLTGASGALMKEARQNFVACISASNSNALGSLEKEHPKH